MFNQVEEYNSDNNLYCMVIKKYEDFQKRQSKCKNIKRINKLKKNPLYQSYNLNTCAEGFIKKKYNENNKYEFLLAYLDYINVITSFSIDDYNIQCYYDLYEDKLKYYNEQLTKYHCIKNGDDGIIEYILINFFDLSTFLKFIAQFNDRFNNVINYILEPINIKL